MPIGWWSWDTAFLKWKLKILSVGLLDIVFVEMEFFKYRDVVMHITCCQGDTAMREFLENFGNWYKHSD